MPKRDLTLRRARWALPVLSLCLLLLVREATSQDLLFEHDDFASWAHPEGLVNVTDEGVSVRPFGTTFNAVADIDDHSSVVIGNFGQRTTRTASNQAHADRIRDQDPSTYWQPYETDQVLQWWIELDLGRAVVADRVRVKFPDEEGARPFSFFSVYTSPGIPVFGDPPRVVYTRLGRPVSNNTEQVVEFSLETSGLSKAAGAYLDTNGTMPFDFVRFVRFEANGRSADAALAEIEVDGVGFNLASMVGTPTRRENGDPHWGGTTWTSKDRDCEGCGKGSGADEMLDEDLGFRTWTTESSDKGEWRKSGVWQTIHFGSVYRVNRVVFVPIVAGRSPILYGFERDKQGPWASLDLLTSDGTPSATSDPEVEGPYFYELLSEVVNGRDSSVDPRYRSDYGRHLFDWQFPPRPVRLLVWRSTRLLSAYSRAVQIFVFHAEGYPAQVELESDDLPLAGGRSIRSVEWDADTPPGTSIQVETQTGNGFQTVRKYFLVNGKEITQAAWEAAKTRNRGPVTEEQVRDGTWSGWSLPHRFSGQAFESPSPRNWLRVRVRLLSEDPEQMPVLRSLRFVANAPVMSAGLQGEIRPHEAALDSLQTFTYRVTPLGFSSGDAGFDNVLVELPGGHRDTRFLEATVGGVPVDATAHVEGDSLLVTLPPPLVRRDSVTVVFESRLAATPAPFGASVWNSDAQDNTQSVMPGSYGDDLVHLPDVATRGALVRNLTVSPAVSPNGDGTNDVLEIDFTLVKTDQAPRVLLHDLTGRVVAELENVGATAGRPSYRWAGDRDGTPVPPGIYLLTIDVDADAGGERLHRTVSVVY